MIGVHCGSFVLLSAKTMTPTTGKQLSYARSACRNVVTVIETPYFRCGDNNSWAGVERVRDEGLRQAAKQLLDNYSKFSTSRVSVLNYMLDHYEQAREEVGRAVDYYGLEVETLPAVTAEMRQRAEDLRVKQAEKERQKKEREAQRASQLQKDQG
jgi:hypothetical protein